MTTINSTADLAKLPSPTYLLMGEWPGVLLENLSGKRHVWWASGVSQAIEDIDPRDFPATILTAPLSREAFLAAVGAERLRHPDKGYTLEHDTKEGPSHLLFWAMDYAARGEDIKGWSMIAAAMDLPNPARPSTPLGDLALQVRLINQANGWDTPLDTVVEKVANLMLIVTEVSEATEEIRVGRLTDHMTINGKRVYRVTNGTGADWTTDPDGDGEERGKHGPATWTGATPKPVGLPSELADIIIRTLDTAARLGIDIDQAVATKLASNRTRGWHHGDKLL